MDFHDFPMILGNLGVETDHPPKMCAGLPATLVDALLGSSAWIPGSVARPQLGLFRLPPFDALAASARAYIPLFQFPDTSASSVTGN